MSEGMEIEYEVSVKGLEEAAIAADAAGRSADQASAAFESASSGTSRVIPMLTAGVRSLNATRLAVEQTAKAITTLDPQAAIYAFLNVMQIVMNLTRLMSLLKESTAAASAAQAVLVTLTGQWWLVALAVAAGALVYAKLRGMQAGGFVQETGVYLLHTGEEVVPANEVELRKTVETTNLYTTHKREIIESSPQIHYGPIFVTFEKQPEEGADRDEWLRSLGSAIAERIRRS
jgi:hypothetical protein